ncbi:Phosphotransferase enzyme family protein [Bacillus sp. THAF10]|uniref:aminoglycoside phosphotransferase family protein n=1 Tax=Bacillus sp. THAF10 TaxID=2587848 RepID=UPI001269051A|nr:aminoglycoside phosphotransferase family protein [Bacillus sp. THAF10]QFT89530.1 Phosphotransferase enzyme family protein [Bacillus sp. THAF10]
MNHQIIAKIPLIKHAENVKVLQKGFSHDKKYKIDDKYLLRVFPKEDATNRKQEFQILNELFTLSDYVPEAIEFGVLDCEDCAYMILEFVAGEDGEVALPLLSEKEQYEVGFKAGLELKKLHQLPAPVEAESWYTVKKRKSDKYLNELKDMPEVDKSVVHLLENHIKINEHLMIDRPNTFQHDDFHPNNLVFHKGKFAGFIDFQQMDWGDPVHDLHKLGFFAIQVSVPFSIGAIDGYHEGKEISDEFWQLFSLYDAMHAVAAIVWGKRMSEEQGALLLRYSLANIKDHDNFEKNVPSWYQTR